MKKIGEAIRFLDKHKGLALFFGSLASVTLGAAYWLAAGGAVAFVTSMQALARPEIAATLERLPAYHVRVESSLDGLEATLAELAAGQRQIADALEAYRAESEKVVDWAREHSQRLTDAVGGCYAGEDCQVFFRGRRTQAGAGCDLRAAKPRLVTEDGEEFPITFSNRFDPVQLTTEFETLSVWVNIPAFIEPGKVGILILNLYAECPFASPGVVVERETFRLLVEIKPRR